jgi:hypothetical protein
MISMGENVGKSSEKETIGISLHLNPTRKELNLKKSRRITRLGKVSKTLSQIKNKNQKTKGLAQVVEHLFSQFEGRDQSPVPHNQLINT